MNSKLDTEKTPVPQDWPSYYLIYRLREAGTSYTRISRLNGYCLTAAEVAVRRPWPKMERLIAQSIGVQPHEIWPSRYHPDGSPKSGRGERGIGRFKKKDSTATRRGNVQHKRAA